MDTVKLLRVVVFEFKLFKYSVSDGKWEAECRTCKTTINEKLKITKFSMQHIVGYIRHQINVTLAKMPWPYRVKDLGLRVKDLDLGLEFFVSLGLEVFVSPEPWLCPWLSRSWPGPWPFNFQPRLQAWLYSAHFLG